MGDAAHVDPDAERPPKRPKQMTVIACNSCKRRKSKVPPPATRPPPPRAKQVQCNGARPACDRCLRLNEQCQYELDSTISRQDGLKRRLREVTAKSDALESIVAQLRSASDLEAAHLIRQLRAGTEVSKLADRSAAPSTTLTSVTDEENRHYYPSPPGEDSTSKLPLDPVMATHSQTSDAHDDDDDDDDDRDESSRSTRSSTPWRESSSPLPRKYPASARTESIPPKRRKLGPLTVARGYVEAFGNMPMSSSIMAGHYPTEIQRHQVANFQIPVHFLQPCWQLDSSPFSRVIQDYRDMARSAFQLQPLPDLSRTDVTYFFTDRSISGHPPEDIPTISTWASEMNKSFEDVDVFVRLACLHFQTKLMMVFLSPLLLFVCIKLTLRQWMIHPTAETYAMMPELIQPTPIQMMVPHISPLDTVPLYVPRHPPMPSSELIWFY